ncbi:hypothetical protein ASA1KI_12050 [Opitutales bacterium ASA1]|uniref:OB-fold-containig protein n=1 Tax=Congregicoccus parvus TaxID=3081749 RepID=UPI002B2E88CF|nr:hypothetical protein ASA1KI_12050 [Opitutales bacterium ASA1]
MSFGEFITAPQVWPFSVALGLFFAITLLEVALALTGFGGNFGIELDPDVAVDTPIAGITGKLFAWLEIGRVPYLVSMAVFLFCFAMLGLFAQNIQFETIGRALPWPLVAFGATLATMPVVRLANRLLGRIWPKDVETSAVSQDSLVGHEAIVVLGVVSASNPGQIKVRDTSGASHHVLAYSDAEDESYTTGEHVLVVARRGASFAVIRHPNPTAD